MSNKKTKGGFTPKLRFPEFQDAAEWEEKQFLDVLDYERPDKYIVSDTRYKQSGMPVLTANKSFILGYTSEEEGVFTDTPVIIFDDFTVDKKYVDFPFKVKSSAIKILKSKDNNNLRFIYEVMTQVKFDAKEHKRYYISAYQNLQIKIPSPAEQQKIADCLTSLDELIAAERAQLDALKAYKKGLLQNLFPSEGESLPALRFPEFQSAGEWETAILGEVYSFKVTNSFSRDQLSYTTGSVKNIHYGDIHTKFSTLFDITKERVPYVNPSQPVEKIKSESYCVEGDMIFADASEDLNDVGKSIEVVNLNNEKLVSGLHTLLARQITPKLAIGFGGYLFKSDRIRTQIKKEAQGAKVLGISSGRLSSIEICFPSDKKEQQKIAEMLTSIDEEIAAQGQRVAGLGVHKKGLLQGLFPSAGEVEE